jgi:hypothetical protein
MMDDNNNKEKTAVAFVLLPLPTTGLSKKKGKHPATSKDNSSSTQINQHPNSQTCVFTAIIYIYITHIYLYLNLLHKLTNETKLNLQMSMNIKEKTWAELVQEDKAVHAAENAAWHAYIQKEEAE